VIDYLLVSPVEWSHLNTDMRKFNLRKKIKANPSQLIPRKPTENLVLELIFVVK